MLAISKYCNGYIAFYSANCFVLSLELFDVIQAEIQTERQRIVLVDNSKNPMDFIKGSGRYDFIIEHDIKELGPHT